MHVVAFTLPAAMLRGGAGTEACPLSGPAPTGNATGSPAHPRRPLPVHCGREIFSVHISFTILILNMFLKPTKETDALRLRSTLRCDSHRDRLSPCTLAFGCPSPRTAALRTQAAGRCTVVSWTGFLCHRSRCTDSTAATSPSFQPLDEQKRVNYMLDKDTWALKGL